MAIRWVIYSAAAWLHDSSDANGLESCGSCSFFSQCKADHCVGHNYLLLTGSHESMHEQQSRFGELTRKKVRVRPFQYNPAHLL